MFEFTFYTLLGKAAIYSKTVALKQVLCRVILCLPISFFVAFHCSAKETVTVFAASSMTNALTEIGKQFDAQNGTETRFSFASSSALARQIAYGAPADIYISANQSWMDYLISQKAVLADTRMTLLTNQLVLVVPFESAVGSITLNESWDIEKALGDSRLAVADPDHVPAGRYAMQSLKSLQIWQRAEPLLARSSNVRAALALVERGEASMGIVYLTDTYSKEVDEPKKVSVIARIPQNKHQPIEYPAVIVRDKSREAVRSLFKYLQSEEAKATFVKYGFGVASAQ